MKQFVRLLLGRPVAAPTARSSRPAPATPSRRSSALRSRRAAPAGTYATITATGLESFAGLTTEIAGFTIASPLVIEPGKRNDQPERRSPSTSRIPTSLLDKDYIIDAGIGIAVTTSGASALTPVDLQRRHHRQHRRPRDQRRGSTPLDHQPRPT